MREWYVVRAKPRKESAAAAMLARSGVEVYLPQLRIYQAHGAPPSHELLFPGYFFGRLDPHLGEIRMANYIAGVHYVLGYDRHPTPVSEELIASIRAQLARDCGRAPSTAYHHGERLIIAAGPLGGIEALFDRRLTGSGRVRVLIDILGRHCPADLTLNQLRRAG